MQLLFVSNLNLFCQSSMVIRDGVTLNLPAGELVPGDLISVKFGDRMPADIRILQCQGFKVKAVSVVNMPE